MEICMKAWIPVWGTLQQHRSARTLNFVKTGLLPDSVLVVTGVSAAGTVARTEKGRNFHS